MDSDVCLGCRFGSVKIEILVPEKCDLKDFAQQTRHFAAEISRVTMHKPIHYSLGINPGQDLAELDFNVNCSCILNINKNDCSKFNHAEDKNCRIKHIPQIKSARETNIEVIRTV